MKFVRAVAKLITNALAYTSDSGNITVVIEEKNSSLLLKIQDDGIGIPLENHSSIFQKFTTANALGMADEPAKQQGLYIVKNIIEWHNGQIWFESKHKQGTTFFIEIPKN